MVKVHALVLIIIVLGIFITSASAYTAEEWYDKGVAQLNKEEYDVALEDFDKAIAINPEYEDAWYNKGRTLKKLNRPEEALEAFDKALSYDQDDSHNWCGRAYALFDLGRYEEALKDLTQAVELEPDYTIGWYNKGLTLNKLGLYDEALEAYNQALAIDPDYDLAIDGKSDLLHAHPELRDTVKNPKPTTDEDGKEGTVHDQQKSYEIDGQKVILNYPSSVTPYRDYHHYFGDSDDDASDHYRWDYNIVINNDLDSTLNFNKIAKLYYDNEGDGPYTSNWFRFGKTDPYSLADNSSLEIEPHTEYSYESWVRDLADKCTFCGGRAEMYYWGTTSAGDDFKFEVTIRLEDASGE